MLPVVHGAEKTIAGRITFLYFDISDPRTKEIQEKLRFRSTPQFLILDAGGTVLAERRGVIAAAEFESWIAETVAKASKRDGCAEGTPAIAP
jgi:hypothetical protein